MQLLDGNKAFHLHINRILVNDGNSSYMSPEYAMDGLFSKNPMFQLWNYDARDHKWQEKQWVLPVKSLFKPSRICK